MATELSLLNRYGSACSHGGTNPSTIPYLVEALADLPEGTVVDGEVVALDDSGRPNFNLLAQFRSEASRIRYFIFDLLVCNDRDLTGLTMSERRELMKSVLTLRSPRIRIAEQFEVTASGMLAAVRQQQLEGVTGSGMRPCPSIFDLKRFELRVLAGWAEFQLLGTEWRSGCLSASPHCPHDGGRCHEVRVVQACGVVIEFLLGNIMGIKQSSAKLFEIRSYEGHVWRSASPHGHPALRADLHKPTCSQPAIE
jgi:hypothetical protein